ncbi:MAG: PEGA domain-containing protein [Deltaproteobacteria bacterium]|nr:PEGA domain-containing protein [Deltaproteobacteria bacterium]
MRRAALILSALPGLTWSATTRADPPTGYVSAVASEPDLEPFAAQVVDSVRAELERGGHLALAAAEARVHGLEAETSSDLDRARGLYAAGREAYDDLELTEAVTKLTRAIALFDTHLRALDDFDVYVDALLRLGAARVLNGNARDADAAFVRVYTLAPQRTPDPEIYPSEVVTRFAETVARARRAGSGALEVQSEPAGAWVYVDGSLRGRAPVRVDDMAAGSHVVRVRSPGFADRAAAASVRARRSESLTLELEPVDGMQEVPSLVSRLSIDVPGGTVEELGRAIEVSRVVLLVFSAGPEGEVALDVRRYDVGSGAAPVRRTASLSQDAVGVEEVVRLALEVVRAQAGEVQTRVRVSNHLPPPPPPPATRGGITTRWWFWTGVGAVVVGGVVLTVALASSGGGRPRGDGSMGEVVMSFR